MAFLVNNVALTRLPAMPFVNSICEDLGFVLSPAGTYLVFSQIAFVFVAVDDES